MITKIISWLVILTTFIAKGDALSPKSMDEIRKNAPHVFKAAVNDVKNSNDSLTGSLGVLKVASVKINRVISGDLIKGEETEVFYNFSERSKPKSPHLERDKTYIFYLDKIKIAGKEQLFLADSFRAVEVERSKLNPYSLNPAEETTKVSVLVTNDQNTDVTQDEISDTQYEARHLPWIIAGFFIMVILFIICKKTGCNKQNKSK
jgi:hypothetical protein